MKGVLLFSCLIAVALAGEPESLQDKADMMLLFPEEHAFSFDTLYGSAAAFATLKAPERVEVYRISPFVDSDLAPGARTILGHEVLSGPAVPAPAARDEFVALFADKNSFSDRPLCGSEPGVLLRASSGTTTVDVLFCFKCRDVVIVRNDEKQAAFDPGMDGIKVSMTPESGRKFLRAFQELFPDDKELQGVKFE